MRCGTSTDQWPFVEVGVLSAAGPFPPLVLLRDHPTPKVVHAGWVLVLSIFLLLFPLGHQL